jgi:Putative phage metallopeptidase
MFEIPEDNDHHPVRWYERLLKAAPEMSDLREYRPDVGFLFRLEDKVKAGRRVLGSMHLPGVNGELSGVFDWMLERVFGVPPVFLMILEKGWWMDAGDREREALVFHECLHARIAEDKWGAQRFSKETGEPVWAIRGHDVEAFNAEVARYGAWKGDIADFLRSAGA